MYHRIPGGKRLIGDSGYIGEPEKVSATLGGHAPETKEFFDRCKSRQESLFTMMKQLNILGGESFRHKGKQGEGSNGRLTVHRLVFELLLSLCNTVWRVVILSLMFNIKLV